MGLSGAWLQLRHLLISRGRHSIHSPFVYEWYNRVCLSKQGTWEQRMESYFAEKGMTIHWLTMDESNTDIPEIAEVIVLRGVHCSAGHYRLWKNIMQKYPYEVSITLRNHGLLIQRQGQVRQHFFLSSFR